MPSPLIKRSLWTAAGLLAAGGLTYLYASRVENRRYKIERVNVITGVPEGDNEAPGEGVTFKVLHLSDSHLSRPETHKIEFLKRVTDEDFDLIVFTGDIFENYSGMEYATRIITRRPRLGAYAVLGNHDYYDYSWMNKTVGKFYRRWRHPRQKRDVQPMIDALADGGIKVLRNESVSLANEHLHLVGLDYPGVSEAELVRLTSTAPENAMVMCLLHLPRKLDKLPRAGVDIAFGGHTHGGQIRIPGIGALITDSELPRKEASGLIWRGDTAIHISRGIGADPKTDFRLFCPPAATIVTIKHFPAKKTAHS